MSRAIATKFIITLLALTVIYSVFWFFKIGQIEKQVNNFISENSSYISAGEVSVSGFPMTQKVIVKDLKFTIPNPAVTQYQISVKHLEIKGGIFANSFVISTLEQIIVQDPEGNSGSVEFAKEPEINLMISDGSIAKFTYKDFGYKVIDAEKNSIYAASSSDFTFESLTEEGKIKNKITIAIKDIEGFDIANIYKNAAEKKVIEGVKTGEISAGSSSAPAAGDVAAVAAVAETVNSAEGIAADASAVAAAAAAAAPATPEVATATPTDAVIAPVVDNSVVKNNFTLDLEYVLTPSQNEQSQPVATDPTQIQETPVQYSKAIKINSLEFSNPLYKISINGQVNSFQDDNMPSGAITITLDKVDNVINHVVIGLNQIIEQRKSGAVDVQVTDLTSTNPAGDDSYQSFLKKIVVNLSSVAKEMAQKNQLSKDSVAVFDVRREKNIEFLVNETPMREILGKF